MRKNRTATGTKTEIYGEELLLFPEKAALHGNDLLLADLHLGKIRHFRKAGYAVPDQAGNDNLDRFIGLIREYEPMRVILLGDLFHSHYNSDWEAFDQILGYFPEIEFILVQGNHDILSDYRYERSRLTVVDSLKSGSFHFTHIPLEEADIPEGMYNLAGHIHPAVGLKGKGRQFMKLPCFYFGEKQGFLPAFGNFTGTHRIIPGERDGIFVILRDQVIKKN